MDFDFTTDSIIPSSGTLNISSATGGIIVPIGDTASRPSSPTEGLIRYNSDNNAFDVYANGQWQALIPTPNTSMVIIEDIFANRPTAGIADRLFISTDTHMFYRDNGTTWDVISAGGNGTVTSIDISQPVAGLTITGGPITTSGTLTFNLANDLAAIEGLSGNGLSVRSGIDTWLLRTITGTTDQILVTNGDGVAGNPTIAISATYPGQSSITTVGTIETGVWNATTIETSKGGTGLTTIGTSNQILGVNSGATELEYKSLIAGTNITITPAAGSLTINSMPTNPASPTNSVQFNNSGSFGGSANFLWDNTNNRLDIMGANQTQRLRIGGSDDPSDAALYIQVNGDTVSEGIRTYFKRSSPGISGWITYHYDGATPNIRLIDEDDDPPYILFNTIGTGTFTNPQFSNYFGSRGPTAGVTNGFEWRVLGNTIATMDTNFFSQPSGTTANRPTTPVAGMTRFNTTTNREEVYSSSNWVSIIGIIDKSTINDVITTAGPNNTYSFIVPGGTLRTDGILRLKLAGRWVNSSGAGRTVTIAVSYGGTTMWADVSPTLATGLSVGWNMELLLCANNSTTSQTLNGNIMIGGTGGVTTGLNGDLGSDEILSNAQIVGNNASINSANNQTLNVTVTFSGSGITWTKYYHTLELI